MKQFSLRDLFFIVAIVALLLGWWVERRNFAAAPGRFQMQVVNGQAVLLDTATGEVHYSGTTTFTAPKIGK
jgi:hypothetical protein